MEQYSDLYAEGNGEPDWASLEAGTRSSPVRNTARNASDQPEDKENSQEQELELFPGSPF